MVLCRGKPDRRSLSHRVGIVWIWHVQYVQQQALPTSLALSTTSLRVAVSPRFACCCGDRHNCPHWLCTRALYWWVSLRHDPFSKSTWLIQFSCHRLMQLWRSSIVCGLPFAFSQVNFFKKLNNHENKCLRSLAKCILYKPYQRNIPQQSRFLDHFS